MGIFYGTSKGLQPLFGQSYGAKNEKDLKYYFRRGMLFNVIGGTFINLILLFVAKPICFLFKTTEETLSNNSVKVFREKRNYISLKKKIV